MSKEISFSVNGDAVSVNTVPERSLLETLREDLGLTGVKYGCGEGACRSCTVLVDGRPKSSCQMTVDEASGKSLVTIEGLQSEDGTLHPIQKAFVEESALQCGYCVPGMILTAKALLDTNANPSEEQINEFMNGNLCRCTNYPYIVNAIRSAASTIGGSGA